MAKRKPKRGASGGPHKPPADDFDSPWKETLDHYFEHCMAFFFPDAHADIDWSRGYEMLDKELQPIVRHSAHGRRYVNKLVKVWLRDGQQALDPDPHRGPGGPGGGIPPSDAHLQPPDLRPIRPRGDQPGDPRRRRPGLAPNRYESARWGFRSLTEFPIVKLIDDAARYQELETNPNPFALVVLAHLKAIETRRSPEDRRAWKVRLVKGLYERGMSPEDVRRLFGFIDWVMELPEGLDDRFWEEIDAYKQEKTMRFVSILERMAEVKGLLQGIETCLKIKFGAEGLELMPELRELRDPVILERVLDRIETGASLEDLRRYVKRSLRAKAARIAKAAKAAESE